MKWFTTTLYGRHRIEVKLLLSFNALSCRIKIPWAFFRVIKSEAFQCQNEKRKKIQHQLNVNCFAINHNRIASVALNSTRKHIIFFLWSRNFIHENCLRLYLPNGLCHGFGIKAKKNAMRKLKIEKSARRAQWKKLLGIFQFGGKFSCCSV